MKGESLTAEIPNRRHNSLQCRSWSSGALALLGSWLDLLRGLNYDDLIRTIQRIQFLTFRCNRTLSGNILKTKIILSFTFGGGFLTLLTGTVFGGHFENGISLWLEESESLAAAVSRRNSSYKDLWQCIKCCFRFETFEPLLTTLQILHLNFLFKRSFTS